MLIAADENRLEVAATQVFVCKSRNFMTKTLATVTGNNFICTRAVKCKSKCMWKAKQWITAPESSNLQAAPEIRKTWKLQASSQCALRSYTLHW